MAAINFNSPFLEKTHSTFLSLDFKGRSLSRRLFVSTVYLLIAVSLSFILSLSVSVVTVGIQNTKMANNAITNCSAVILPSK